MPQVQKHLQLQFLQVNSFISSNSLLWSAPLFSKQSERATVLYFFPSSRLVA